LVKWLLPGRRKFAGFFNIILVFLLMPVHDFTPGQLSRLLAKVQDIKRKAELWCMSVNPPLDPTRNSGYWIDADFVEKLVLAELQRRQPARKEQPAKVKPEQPALLSLEDAFEDAAVLPKVWGILAAQERPLFDIAGNFIREGEKAKHAALYAFAVATKTRNLLKRNVSPKDIYLILCDRNEIEPTDRPDKVTKGKRDYSDYLAAITDYLRDV